MDVARLRRRLTVGAVAGAVLVGVALAERPVPGGSTRPAPGGARVTELESQLAASIERAEASLRGGGAAPAAAPPQVAVTPAAPVTSSGSS